MMTVRSSVKYSPIHGIGCFAEEDIKKGEIVWEFDSRLDIVIPEEDLDKFSKVTVEFFKTYCYAQKEGSKKIFILCGDHARHMNHSETPNLIEVDGPNGKNVADRDIKKGEELTCDYHLFDLNVNEKLNKKAP